MYSVFNNVLTLFQIEQTNQTVMSQKLQKLKNKQRRRGGAILYCKNIAQISRSPRKKSSLNFKKKKEKQLSEIIFSLIRINKLKKNQRI